MTLIRVGVPRVPAEANWGRWIVKCPTCPSALTLEPQTPLFRCTACGSDAEVVWPPEETVYGVERLLLMRPDESTRNWVPGETLIDLMVENGAHGIFAAVEMSPGQSVLSVDDYSIRRDVLPVTRQRVLSAVAA